MNWRNVYGRWLTAVLALILACAPVLAETRSPDEVGETVTYRTTGEAIDPSKQTLMQDLLVKTLLDGAYQTWADFLNALRSGEMTDAEYQLAASSGLVSATNAEQYATAKKERDQKKAEESFKKLQTNGGLTNNDWGLKLSYNSWEAFRQALISGKLSQTEFAFAVQYGLVSAADALAYRNAKGQGNQGGGYSPRDLAAKDMFSVSYPTWDDFLNALFAGEVSEDDYKLALQNGLVSTAEKNAYQASQRAKELDKTVQGLYDGAYQTHQAFLTALNGGMLTEEELALAVEHGLIAEADAKKSLEIRAANEQQMGKDGQNLQALFGGAYATQQALLDALLAGELSEEDLETALEKNLITGEYLEIADAIAPDQKKPFQDMYIKVLLEGAYQTWDDFRNALTNGTMTDETYQLAVSKGLVSSEDANRYALAKQNKEEHDAMTNFILMESHIKISSAVKAFVSVYPTWSDFQRALYAGEVSEADYLFAIEKGLVTPSDAARYASMKAEREQQVAAEDNYTRITTDPSLMFIGAMLKATFPTWDAFRQALLAGEITDAQYQFAVENGMVSDADAQAYQQARKEKSQTQTMFFGTYATKEAFMAALDNGKLTDEELQLALEKGLILDEDVDRSREARNTIDEETEIGGSQNLPTLPTEEDLLVRELFGEGYPTLQALLDAASSGKLTDEALLLALQNGLITEADAEKSREVRDFGVEEKQDENEDEGDGALDLLSLSNQIDQTLSILGDADKVAQSLFDGGFPTSEAIAEALLSGELTVDELRRALDESGIHVLDIERIASFIPNDPNGLKMRKYEKEWTFPDGTFLMPSFGTSSGAGTPQDEALKNEILKGADLQLDGNTSQQGAQTDEPPQTAEALLAGIKQGLYNQDQLRYWRDNNMLPSDVILVLEGESVEGAHIGAKDMMINLGGHVGKCTVVDKGHYYAGPGSTSEYVTMGHNATMEAEGAKIDRLYCGGSSSAGLDGSTEVGQLFLAEKGTAAIASLKTDEAGGRVSGTVVGNVYQNGENRIEGYTGSVSPFHGTQAENQMAQAALQYEADLKKWAAINQEREKELDPTAGGTWVIGGKDSKSDSGSKSRSSGKSDSEDGCSHNWLDMGPEYDICNICNARRKKTP